MEQRGEVAKQSGGLEPGDPPLVWLGSMVQDQGRAETCRARMAIVLFSPCLPVRVPSAAWTALTGPYGVETLGHPTLSISVTLSGYFLQMGSWGQCFRGVDEFSGSPDPTLETLPCSGVCSAVPYLGSSAEQGCLIQGTVLYLSQGPCWYLVCACRRQRTPWVDTSGHQGLCLCREHLGSVCGPLPRVSQPCVV